MEGTEKLYFHKLKSEKILLGKNFFQEGHEYKTLVVDKGKVFALIISNKKLT